MKFFPSRTKLKSSVASTCLRFATNQKASTSAIFAVSVLPVLGLVGASVEYQRFNGMKAQAQAAADQAVLAVGAKPNASHDVHATLAANVAAAAFGARPGVTVTVAPSDVVDVTPGSTWQVTVHGAASTVIGGILGLPTMHFAATAKATNYGATAAKPLELALALDNTGSMSNNMTDLKNAAKSLVQQVLNGGGGAARVAIVPYVAAVNPGLTDATSIANYIDTTALGPWNGVWLAGKWIDQASGCTPSWGSGSGGAGSGGSGDARDILDILKPIRHMAQELFGVSSAHAADVTPNTIAPITTKTWTSSKTGRTYTMPVGFQGIAKDIYGAGSTGGCDYLANPATVSQYELFKRTLDPNGNPVAWKGCVEARITKAEQTWLNSNWGQSYAASTEYDVSETPPTTSDPLSLFTPYFWPDEPDYSPYTWNVVTPGAYASSTQGFHNNYLDDKVGAIQTGWGWTAMGSVSWGNGQLLMKYDGKTKAAIIQETPDSAGFTYGPNAGCPDPVMRLTSNQGNAVNKINGLNYWQSGGTVISEGLMWAWRALSPNAPYADGVAYNTPGVTKAIVLMTDGVNELIDNGNNASSFITANLSDYSAYGYLGSVRLQNANSITTYSGVNTFFDNRLLAACTAAKRAGVQIYTVTFNHAGFLTTAQQQHAQSILQQCATSNSNAFLATDASSLNTAFTTIATTATAGALRLIP